MKWHRGLFARVVLHSFTLLGATVALFVLVELLWLRPRMEAHAARFERFFAGYACGHATDGELASMPVPLRLVRADGSVVARSLEADGPSRPFTRSAPCPNGELRVEFAGPPAGPLASPSAVLLLLLAAAVVMLASIPLARSLTAPIEELVRAARRFGRGDFTARATLARDDELGELGRELDAMARNLDQLLRGEKELIGTMSHELRTPLARMLVLLETLREAPHRLTELTGELARDLRDLSQLTTDILLSVRLEHDARAEAARDAATPAPEAALGPLLQRALAQFAELAPERELSLELPEPAPWVRGDEALLLRLFANLLDNARKYSEHPIAVSVEVDGEWVRVRVEDRGIGIHPDELPRLFTPFFRASAGRALGVSGTGLGLALCRQIAVAHGGRIAVESTPGVRTTVTVTLPRVR